MMIKGYNVVKTKPRASGADMFWTVAGAAVVAMLLGAAQLLTPWIVGA